MPTTAHPHHHQFTADLTTAGYEVTPYQSRLPCPPPAVTVATLAQVAPHTARHTGPERRGGPGITKEANVYFPRCYPAQPRSKPMAPSLNEVTND